MEPIANPVIIDAVLTIAAAIGLLGISIFALWLLPWTDRDIRSVDRVLNPLDLTEESLPLRRLAFPRS